jgi:hypothetical protein
MKRQTAVDWLVKEFSLENFTATIELVKQKEKEQMYNAWKKSAIQNSEYDIIDEIEYDVFENYYNQTYKPETI